jgi:hypothetical protein
LTSELAEVAIAEFAKVKKETGDKVTVSLIFLILRNM